MCSADEAGQETPVAPCRQARLPLSHGRIIDAALCYVDANCLADMSMRRLGGELGVEAMSLYRYFPSKAALLDSVVCRLLSDVELPEPGDGARWEPRARAYARSFRAIARAHPRLFPLLATVGPDNTSLVNLNRRMTNLWREAGMDECMAERAQRALHGFVTGSSLWEVTSGNARRDAVVQDGAADRPPSPTRDDPDAAFEFGLDLLFRALRQHTSAEAVPAR
jgi:AcrR family transcriptional regulator